MRAEYCVEPTVKVHIAPTWETPDKICIGGTYVYFDISDRKLLKQIKIVYTGLSIEWVESCDKDGKLILVPQRLKELTSKAHKIMSYILNYIHIEKEVYIFDTRELKSIQPKFSTENSDEEQYLSTLQKSARSFIIGAPVAKAYVRFDNIEERFNHAKVYANFADAENAQNPITKYESLYKVIENFFSGTGNNFDQCVSDFMIQHDSTFTPDNFEKLRVFRNRCIHPQHRNGHITSIDIELTEELTDKTNKLKKIAELLLKHK